MILKLFLAFPAAYLILCGYLYYFQERQIFFPPPESYLYERLSDKNKISLDVNGLTLNGIRSIEISNKNPLLIYFGGNAEDVVYNFSDFNNLNIQFVAVNYRGFAGNEGKATIRDLVNDAQKITEEIIDTYTLNPEKVFLMGRSLGAALAVQVLKHREYAGIILISPFDSMTNIAKRHFSWFPVSILLKHPLNSVEIAKQSNTPVLIIAAENDRIIPMEHSKVLYDAWLTQNKDFKIIKDLGHNTIHDGSGYYNSISHFIR